MDITVADDVELRDGSTVHIRPVLAEDRIAVRAFLGALSSESVGCRFFGAVDLDWAADWSVDVNDADRYGLIATAGPGRTVVAHGGYVRERSVNRSGVSSCLPVQPGWLDGQTRGALPRAGEMPLARRRSGGASDRVTLQGVTLQGVTLQGAFQTPGLRAGLPKFDSSPVAQTPAKIEFQSLRETPTRLLTRSLSR
ncbi:MAG: hypothetical protein ABI323_13640 [Solirubrobacteraceae bacterium]